MMKKITWLALTCITALLGACADMGNIKPQSRQMDANTLDGGKQLASSSAAIAAQWPQLEWWHAYGDPQLDMLIATALADNPSLHIAEARVRQAQAFAGMAESATLPTVGASTSMTRQLFSEHDFIPPPEAGNYAWYNRVAVEATYDLDLWGKQRQALAAALDEVKVAAAESQMARLALENNIVRSYVQLSLQFALKDIVEDTLSHREKSLHVMRQRLAAGLATEVDVTQLEAAVPPLHMQIEQHEESITLLRNQLAALTGKGRAAGEKIALPTLALNSNTWLQLPTSLPADLIGRRPDVAARRWGVEVAAKKIEVAKASFYPNINLMAFVGFQSIGFSRFLNSESAIRGIGPAISLPIFDGGRLRSNLGAHTAEYDIAVESYNGTLIHALENVASTLIVAQSLQQQKNLNDGALATAGRARMLASKGFAAGMTDFLVLLNSEVALLTQQQQQAQITARMMESHAALMLALGGGYSPEQVESSAAATSSQTQNTRGKQP
ncbi:MAG: efflux transporter outer membrane subunit [Herminiimonas sp.]|nr:efflux transporter outer membrane subunit [Herminiimonas sp.]MDO9421150.1 efflux transporter outer membrane subunit [Herminiimonas sp.]